LQRQWLKSVATKRQLPCARAAGFVRGRRSGFVRTSEREEERDEQRDLKRVRDAACPLSTG